MNDIQIIYFEHFLIDLEIFFNNPSPNIATKEIFSLQKYIFMEALNKLVCNVEASLRLIFYHDQTWIESEQS